MDRPDTLRLMRASHDEIMTRRRKVAERKLSPDAGKAPDDLADKAS